MSCKHRDMGADGFFCVHPEIRQTISPDRCDSCPHYNGRPRGLGDVIHRVAEVTGVSKVVPKSCGCQKRREVLNEIVPNPLK